MWRWWRRRSDEDFAEEISAHISLEMKRLVEEEGMNFNDAKAQALRSFGNIARAQEQFYERGQLAWLEDLRRDVRYALRTLRRNPGFAAVTILTLAIGIGAAAAIYSVVDTILLQPLPFPDSDRLVRLVENVPHAVVGRPPLPDGVGHRGLLEWRARTQTLSDVAGITYIPGIVRIREGPARLSGGMISANTFTMLGTRAMLGRTLDTSDEANPDVVVLSFDAWRRVFHSDPEVLGATIEFRRRLLTVIGVLPDGFVFPSRRPLDFYTPFAGDDVLKLFSGDVIGRLRSGVSLNAATDEANLIGSAIPPRNANTLPLTIPRFEVQFVKDQMVQALRPALRVFLGAVAVVLLMVCANVANLLLARATTRQREIAVRFALGASRARVVRQVLTECAVLAIVGGTVGALLGAAGVTLVKELASIEAPGMFRTIFGTSILPRGNEVGINLKMFGIAFSIAAITSLAFGVLPALHLSRSNHLRAMGSRGGGSGRGESRIRTVLVVGQVVMATVLLVGAGLLLHSFVKLSTVEKGYDPSNVLTFQLVFSPGYPLNRKTDTIEALLERLGATSDVESAGFTRHGILIPEEIFVGTFVPQGRTLTEMRAEPQRPGLRPVSHGYLTAAGVRLIDGRPLAATDDATSTPVIVISRTVATRYFGSGRPIGQFVDWHVGNGPVVQMQVVGVVEDVRNVSPDREAHPEIFVEYRQLLALQQRWGSPIPVQDSIALGFVSFAVRTRSHPASAIPRLGQIVRSVDPNAGIDAIVPMERLVASSVGRQRFYTTILGVFAGIAGLLAAIGIYGVLAYAVTQRTQEIGIRMALGAERRQVLTLVLRKGLVLATIGIALGLIGAAVSTRVLQSMLFEITPLDRTTFIAVALLFGTVATIAALIPAQRAVRISPLTALRYE